MFFCSSVCLSVCHLKLYIQSVFHTPEKLPLCEKLPPPVRIYACGGGLLMASINVPHFYHYYYSCYMLTAMHRKHLTMHIVALSLMLLQQNEHDSMDQVTVSYIALSLAHACHSVRWEERAEIPKNTETLGQNYMLNECMLVH